MAQTDALREALVGQSRGCVLRLAQLADRLGGLLLACACETAERCRDRGEKGVPSIRRGGENVSGERLHARELTAPVTVHCKVEPHGERCLNVPVLQRLEGRVGLGTRGSTPALPTA